MIETFAALVFAHVLADFLFQTSWMVANKHRAAGLALHGGVVLVLTAAALGRADAWAVAALAAAHMAIDAAKTRLGRGGLGSFLADQAAHLATLIAVAALAPGLWAGGLWAAHQWLPGAMVLVAGLLLATRAGGFAVGLLMQPYAGDSPGDGLPRGGALIGLLERGLIFLFLMADQPAAIGFLIAAKSVLRFSATSTDRRASEYVIIGTLASFGWALVAAHATLALLGHLAPLGIWPPKP